MADTTTLRPTRQRRCPRDRQVNRAIHGAETGACHQHSPPRAGDRTIRAETWPTTAGRAVYCCHCHCHCCAIDPRTDNAHVLVHAPSVRPHSEHGRCAMRARDAVRVWRIRSSSCHCPAFGDEQRRARGARTSVTSLQVKRTVERQHVGLRAYGFLIASCRPGPAVLQHSCGA